MSKLVKLFEDKDIMVSELKRDCILNIIEEAKKYSKITKIILFGSSLEERCTERSDIDIAVFTSLYRSELFRRAWYGNFTSDIYTYNMNQHYDILPFKEGYNDDSLIMENIYNGSVIYENLQK